MKIKKIALAGLVGLTSIGAVTPVLAEKPAAEYKSNANIEFIENNDITGPVDPTDPEEPVTPQPDPENPEEIPEGTKGPLSIDYASHLNFGKVKISGNKETYYAKAINLENSDGETVKRAPYVQVTDNRGSKAGWDLQVSQSAEFTNAKENTLKGALLSIGDGKVRSASSVENVDSKDIAFNNIGEKYSVMTAAEDSGAGTFTNLFGELNDEDLAESVSLMVPADLKIDQESMYTTELEWTLLDAPGA